MEERLRGMTDLGRVTVRHQGPFVTSQRVDFQDCVL